MKMIHPFSLLGLLILVISGCFSTAFAQPQSQDISAQDVRAYIEKSRRSGTFGQVEEKYVLDNFNRTQLVETIANWQARNRTKLSKEIKIMILVDYLLTELKRVNVLPKVLDSIAKGKPTSVGKELTEVAFTSGREYQAGNIQIEVNINNVDVEIDGKPFGQSQNKDTFVVTPAQPHVVVITKGSSNCNKTIIAAAGKTVVMPCTLH